MRFIPSTVHGVMDYLFGAVLVIAPWFMGYGYGGSVVWVAVLTGAWTILYSLFTRYELGLSKKITYRVHLWFDGLTGLFLIAAPWFFGFHAITYIPYVAVGVFEICVTLLSHPYPQTVAYNAVRQERDDYVAVYKHA